MAEIAAHPLGHVHNIEHYMLQEGSMNGQYQLVHTTILSGESLGSAIAFLNRVQQFDHPNVIKIKYVCEEWPDGACLESVWSDLSDDGPIGNNIASQNMPRVIKIYINEASEGQSLLKNVANFNIMPTIEGIKNGLDFLHSEGIALGNLSASSVMLYKGVAKISFFLPEVLDPNFQFRKQKDLENFSYLERQLQSLSLDQWVFSE